MRRGVAPASFALSLLVLVSASAASAMAQATRPPAVASAPAPPGEEVVAFNLLLDRYRDERLAGDEAATRTLEELEARAERFALTFGRESPRLRVRFYRALPLESLRVDREGEAKLDAARSALDRGDAKEAEAAAAEGAALFGRIDHADRLAVAEDLLAKAAGMRGDPAAAARHLGAAAAAFRRIRSRTGEAMTLGELGHARAAAGDAGWRTSFDEALAAAAGDAATEAHLLADRGWLALAESEDEEALANLRDALARGERAGATESTARALLGIAEIHLNKRDVAPARAALARAEALAGGAFESTLADLHARAETLDKHFAEARRHAERALAAAGGDPRRRLHALVVAGVATARAGDRDLARERLAEAARGAAGRYPRIEARALHDLAALALEDRDPALALERLEGAVAAARRLGDDEAVARSLALRASAHFEAGEVEASIEAGLLARRAFEPLIETSATDRGRDLLAAGGVHDAAETAIRAFLRRGRPGDASRAFEVAEWARARALLGDLRELGIDPEAELPREAREARAALLRRYRLLCAAIESAADAAVAERFRGDLDRVVQEIASLAASSRGPAGRAGALFAEADANAVRAFAKRTGTTVLLAFVGEVESFLFVVGASGVEVRALPPKALLEPRVSALVEAAERSALVPQARARFPALAAALADLLLPADLRAAFPANGVVVIPDGVLEEVPFECFASPGSKAPMAGGPPFSYAPSCAVLLGMDRRAQRPGGRDERPVLVAARAIGAPELSFDRSEVAAVVSAFDRSGVVRLEGAACRETEFLEQVGRFRVLHLSLHGRSERSRVGLAFSPGGDDDGILWPHEVYGLSVSPDLVVLSGCATGSGERLRGAGVLGLAHAFLFAGASRVVVSLWAVDDEAAATTMETFYEGMRAGKGPAAALRDARRRVAGRPSHGEPFYWAPFVLIGPP